MDAENKILLLEQEFKDYKQHREKEMSEIKKDLDNHEQRLLVIEKSKEKTDFQYEEIIKTLNKLNEVTIPNLTAQIEELKNKPVKRYDQAISAVIGAIFGAVGTTIVNVVIKNVGGI